MKIFNLRKGNARRIFLVLAVIATSSALITVSFTGCAKKEPTQISVRLKWIPNAAFSGEIIALKKGFFEKNGLKVEIRPGGFENDPIKLVAAGADDIGITGADQLVLARAKDIPLVAIGVIFQSSPVVFVSKKESGITDPFGFENRKIGVRYGTDVETIYRALVKKLHIDPRKTEEIPMKFDLSPFLDGRVELLPTYSTAQMLELEKMGIELNYIYPGDYGIRPYGMCYFVTEQTLKERPDVLYLYLRAVAEGYDWAISHKEEAARMVLEFNDRLNYEIELRMLEVIEPILKGESGLLFWMTRERWQATADVHEKAGTLLKTPPVDSLFSTELINRLYERELSKPRVQE